MENLTYVTGNYGKYISVKEKFEQNNIYINYYSIDINKPNVNDISFISREKARNAFDIVGKPVFVVDNGFYIENYPDSPGFPGAFVKRSGVSSNIDDLLKTMKNVKNRDCYFMDCLTFYDGEDFHQFYGVSKGTLSKKKKGSKLKKAKSDLWYVFIPYNCNKTLAEMSDFERLTIEDERTSATENFIKWYIENRLDTKRKIKRLY